MGQQRADGCTHFASDSAAGPGVADLLRALLKEQGQLFKTLHKNNRNAAEGASGGFNWLLTFVGRDTIEFASIIIAAFFQGMRAYVCMHVCRAYLHSMLA